MKGGYQILSLGTAAATGSAVIDGAYSKATAGKALLLEGYGPTQYVPAGVAVEGSVTITTAAGDEIVIDQDDTVTITAAE